MAVRPVDEAILPVEDYKLPEVRALAEAHGDDLVALYQDVRRCAPELDFQLDGIAFQKPRQAEIKRPYLTLWVFLDSRMPPTGPSPATRASEAVRQYGRKMIRRLSAREPVAADVGVGGYGVVLSWAGPKRIKDQAVMESLVVFSRKERAAAFGDGQIGLRDFLAASDVKLFDGQEELSFPELTTPDLPGPPGLGTC